VIALGKKAERRVKLAGRVPDATVRAGKPGCYRKDAKPSWQAAGAAFNRHLQRRTPPAPEDA
jgi:hypothetical protein